MNEESIFAEAIEISDVVQRAVFLQQVCGSNVELLRMLNEIVQAHFDDNLLDRPAVNLDITRSFGDKKTSGVSQHAEPLIEDLVAGRYRLLEPLGEGGMGAVYRAEQIHPVQRYVAIKFIRPGLSSEGVILRFEAERQALAVMDHPGIAKVLDAGTLATGQPFFVMELVEGKPLTAYAQNYQLPLSAKLNLFIEVCKAVQHAHQKGIIHRDLKPGNILVTEVDGKAIPKVIDFGLAKALSGNILPDVTHDSSPSVKGTLLYMAPEQADPHCVDIDTRADVYALGVILFELITETTPIKREDAKKWSYEQILRQIVEVHPPAPSQRIAATLSRDLDLISLKALSIDRQLRYESAIDLARDVERFLQHQPVLACPPSSSYLVKKFIRRHRVAVVTGVFFAVAIIAGIIGTTIGFLRADAARIAESQQRTLAEDRLIIATKAQESATEQAIRANREALASEQVSSFLVGLFESRDQMGFFNINLNFRNHQTDSTQSQDFLVRGIERLQTDIGLKAQPLVRGRLAFEIAKILVSLGQLDRALPLAKDALRLRREHLAAGHEDILSSLRLVAQLEYLEGNYTSCVDRHREILAMLENGEETLDLALTKASLATCIGIVDLKEANKLITHSYAIQKRLLGATDFRTITTGYLHAMIMSQHDNKLGALQLTYQLKADLEAAKANPELLQIVKTALECVATKGTPKYISAHRTMVDQLVQVFGATHFMTFRAKTRLASVLYDHFPNDSPELAESAKISEEIVSIGPKWERTYSRLNLGRTYMRLNRHEEAEKCIKTVVDEYRKTIPELNANHLPHSLELLAWLYDTQQAKADQIPELLQEAMTAAKANPKTSQGRLCVSIMAVGRYRYQFQPKESTVELFAEAAALGMKEYGQDDLRYLEAKAYYQAALRRAGQVKEADLIRQEIQAKSKSYVGVARIEAARIRALLSGKIPTWHGKMGTAKTK